MSYPATLSRGLAAITMGTLLAVPALSNVQAGSNSAVISLTVGGSIAARPQWQSSSNAEIPSLTMTFAGFAEATAAAIVNSNNAQAKLVNATAYPANVAAVRPSSCTIGGTAVAQTDIRLVSDASGTSTEYTDATISIATNALYTYSLRFLAGYGNLSGTVSCTTPGSLTYSY